VEHARNVLGMADASHAEYGASGTPVVAPFTCSPEQVESTVYLARGSLLARLHATAETVEATTCSYGLAPGFGAIASSGGMMVAATDGAGGVRAVERPGHPFFIGTLYQPQLKSAPGSPHPVFAGLLRAAAGSAPALA
jgi:CTP synthase (UTP-ammonia lyase)